MSTDPAAGARSYLDFTGLAQLRGQAADPNNASALREGARQFEAQFIQMMMKSMREATVFRGELTDTGTSDTWQDMMDREVSVQMARRGALGIADMLERQLSGGGVSRTPPSTTDVLASRLAGVETPAPMPLQREAGGLPLPAASAPLPLPGARHPAAGPVVDKGDTTQ